ncbi:MAG TPA: hypothetical protein VEP90_06125, partial [Methylomirabilota bacterium]|nr:hypothetical protein [Methylomirabilota bacterium]
NSQETRSGLGLASPHRTSLHNNRYGVYFLSTNSIPPLSGRKAYLNQMNISRQDSNELDSLS